MRTVLLVFLGCLWFGSCKVNYFTTQHDITFQDSIDLSDSYKLYVRKLAYDMESDQIVLCNNRDPDTTKVKLIELDYLFFNTLTKSAILIPYVPSFYYEHDKKDKGGLYTKIYSDSTVYLHQVRRINFMSHWNNDTLLLGDYKYQFTEQEDDIVFTNANSLINNYLMGTIHLNEALGCAMRFSLRESYSFQQFIPDTVVQNIFFKKRNEKIKTQLRVMPQKQFLYILHSGKRKGLGFRLTGTTKAIFRKKATNYFSNKK